MPNGCGSKSVVAALLGLLVLGGCRWGHDAPASYSVTASVSGLAGSGLGLTTGNGEIVDVSANGSVTLATGLSNGASFAVTVDTQPINPVQTCSVADGSGTVNGASVSISVSCMAGNASTVNAARVTVAIDSSVPTSVTYGITTILSPMDSQGVGTPLVIPVSVGGGETLVVAADADNNIMLASLATSHSVTLSSDSTALALTRTLMGALPASVAPDQLNAAIRATAEYPNLVSLVTVALQANTSPATSTPVFTSIGMVLSEVPASTLTASVKAARLGVRASAALLATPTVTAPTPSHPQYNLYTTSVAGTVYAAVAVTGAAGNGDLQVSNTTAIAWSLASADTSGNWLACAPAAQGPITNPDCAATISGTGLLQNALTGVVSTGTVKGGLDAFNITLEQNAISRTSNVLQVGEDVTQVVLAYVSAGTAAIAPGCTNSILNSFFPPTQLAALVLDPSPAAFQDYLKEVFASPVQTPLHIISLYYLCRGVQLPIGSNPVAQITWQTAITNLINTALNSAVNTGLTAGGIPLEAYETWTSWSIVKPFGLCEGGNPMVIVNCATALTFTPAIFTMVPGTSFTPTLTATDSSGATTPTPPDLTFTSPADLVSIRLNGNTGTVYAIPLMAGIPGTPPAVVTVTDTSTGVQGQFSVVVTSVAGMQVAAMPATLPLSGGIVTITASLGPPQLSVPGSPTPTGTVTFVDGSGLALCSDAILNAGIATCQAMIAGVTSDTITATYYGNSSYSVESGTATVTFVAPSPEATTTALVVYPIVLPATGGSAVLTATVSSASAPAGVMGSAGSVEFLDQSGVVLCPAIALSAVGIAVCNATLSAAPATITAIFSGDIRFAPSTGTAGVSPATTFVVWHGQYLITTCTPLPPQANPAGGSFGWQWENPCEAVLPFDGFAVSGGFSFVDGQPEVVFGSGTGRGLSPTGAEDVLSLGWSSSSDNLSVTVPTAYSESAYPYWQGAGSRTYNFVVTNRFYNTLSGALSQISGTFTINMTSAYCLIGADVLHCFQTTPTTASGVWSAGSAVEPWTLPQMNGYDFCFSNNAAAKQQSGVSYLMPYPGTLVPKACTFE